MKTKACYSMTTISVQGNEQEVFEVYSNEEKELTLGFVYGEQMANLLSSAPEMLDFLKACGDCRSGDELEDFIVNNIEDVIASAEGSQQGHETDHLQPTA